MTDGDKESDKKATILKTIKDLCDSDGREIDPEKSAEYFYQLASTYQDDSQQSFICKSTLLNASLSRITDEDRRALVEIQICKLGKDLLERCNAKRKDLDLLEISRKIGKDLHTHRSVIKSELLKLPQLPTSASGADLLNLENERIQKMRSLMQKVSEFYIQTMREVSRTCMGALGETPCRFAHFAMGSLAREEITLYSDFENGILLDDEAVPEACNSSDSTADESCAKREEILEFFRWYAVLLHVILINFGQTPIHMVGIEGLNDQYSENPSDNWFYDVHTPSGITFDSFLPYASKTPFGRRPTTAKPYSTELILPVREMLKFLGEEISLTEGYHLSDMLVESRHVAGDKDLFVFYQKKAISMMTVLRECSDYIETTARTAKEDLKKFDLTPEFISLGWRQNVKKLYYRPMSVYIPWLMRTCGVLGFRNSFEAIEKLTEENSSQLSAKAKHNLSYALAVANQLRLEVYADRSRQSDMVTGSVNLLNKTANIMNVFDAVGDRSALDYCEISLGLRSAVIEIVDAILLSLEKIGRIDIKQILLILDRHVRCRDNWKLQLVRCESEASVNAKERKVEILMTLGLTCLISLRFLASVRYYQKVIDLEAVLDRSEISKYNIATACTMMGQSFIELPPKRENFGPYVKKGIRLWEELISSDPTNAKYLKGLAEARDTEAFYYLRTQQHRESLEKYTEAAKLFEQFYGKDVVNDDTLKVQNGIAMCHLGLKRYNEAVQMFEKIISMKQSVVGHEVADVTISWYLRSKADALKNLERFDEAIETYKLSASMREAAPGSEYDKFAAIGNTTCRLADCYYRCERFDEALRTADEVLIIVKHIPNTMKGKEFTGLAEKLKKDVNDKQKMQK